MGLDLPSPRRKYFAPVIFARVPALPQPGHRPHRQAVSSLSHSHKGLSFRPCAMAYVACNGRRLAS